MNVHACHMHTGWETKTPEVWSTCLRESYLWWLVVTKMLGWIYGICFTQPILVVVFYSLKLQQQNRYETSYKSYYLHLGSWISIIIVIIIGYLAFLFFRVNHQSLRFFWHTNLKIFWTLIFWILWRFLFFRFSAPEYTRLLN